MAHRIRLIALVTLFVGLTSLVRTHAQPGQTRVKSGTDAIQIETTVTDAAGRPVPDLTASDFVVRVDGEPRPVTFARFYGSTTAETGTDEPVAALTASNQASAPGRVVLVVVDLESLVPGMERTLLDTAAKLVDALRPGDAVGLMALPGAGIDLTRDHRRVSDALHKMIGISPSRSGWRSMSIDEAEAFERQDRRVMNAVIERECRRGDPACPRELADSAREILTEASRRIQTVVKNLATVIGRLQSIDAPKSILLLSGGFPWTTGELSYFRELQTRAATSHARVYVVQAEQPQSDASSRRPGDLGTFKRQDLASGLSHVAGVTDGQVFAGVGRATGVFERIKSEVLNSYMLAVDARPTDLDGKPHKIDVRVQRAGVAVRARKQLVATPSPAVARKVMDVLAQPVDLTEVPLVASAYSTRGEEAETLKVILSLESPGIDAAAVPGSYGLSILKNDQVAFSSADSMPAGEGVVLAAQLAPGRYRLRAAIVDGNNRAGSLDMALSIGLRQTGDLQLSDLLVGTVGEKFRPSTHVRSAARLAALVELYAFDPAAFESTGVHLELRKAGEDVVLRQATATISATSSDRRRVAEGHVPLEGLARGRYALSAIVHRTQQPLGKVTRMFDVITP